MDSNQILQKASVWISWFFSWN